MESLDSSCNSERVEIRVDPPYPEVTDKPQHPGKTDYVPGNLVIMKKPSVPNGKAAVFLSASEERTV